MSEPELWGFLNRELARLNTIIDCYKKLEAIINIKDDRYNQSLRIILDSLLRTTSIGLANFFDKTKGTWSLYRFQNMPESYSKSVDILKDEASKIIVLRHNRLSHLSKNIQHENNFILLSSVGISLVENLVTRIHDLLTMVSKEKHYNSTYALEWVGVETSLQCLIEDLTKEGHV